MTERLPRINRSDDNQPESAALASLQNDLEAIKNDRNEERFLFSVVIVVLINTLIFSIVEHWAGALVIGIIEIFGVAVLARRLRIEEVPQILSKFLDRTAERVNPQAPNSAPTEPPTTKPSTSDTKTPPDPDKSL